MSCGSLTGLVKPTKLRTEDGSGGHEHEDISIASSHRLLRGAGLDGEIVTETGGAVAGVGVQSLGVTIQRAGPAGSNQLLMMFS